MIHNEGAYKIKHMLDLSRLLIYHDIYRANMARVWSYRGIQVNNSRLARIQRVYIQICIPGILHFLRFSREQGDQIIPFTLCDLFLWPFSFILSPSPPYLIPARSDLQFRKTPAGGQGLSPFSRLCS